MTAIATLPILLGTGIHADRPAAGDVGSGGLYSCTTHSLVYQTDGTTWTTWATLGGSSDLDAIIAASAGENIADALSGAAAPTAGNVFATMADVGGGGGGLSDVLEQHTATNASQFLDFTAFISSTYDHYLFEVVDLHLASDNIAFQMLYGTGGGPTYATADYAWCTFRFAPAGSATAGSGSTSSFGLDGSGGIDNGANYGLSGFYHLFSPQSSTYKRTTGQLAYTDNAITPLCCIFQGNWAQTTALTAVRFQASTGNIVNGTIRVKGFSK